MGSIFVNNTPAVDRPVSDEYPFDPSLLPAIKKLLPKFETEEKKSAYAEHLARKIKRNPRDLRSHTQRIYLNYILKNEDAYFGALIDLFIVLGPKGLALKKSILRPTNFLLENEHASFIRKHLHSGINAAQAIPTNESRLSKGISSTTDIVTRKLSDGKTYSSLSSAKEKLSLGEIKSARILLENALEEDPADLEIAYELLELYRDHKMQKEFTTMTTRLTGKTLASQEKWSETEKYFSQN